MKQLSNAQEKELIKLENTWLKHKRLRHKPEKYCKEHADFLSMQQREEILDKTFRVIFDD